MTRTGSLSLIGAALLVAGGPAAEARRRAPPAKVLALSVELVQRADLFSAPGKSGAYVGSLTRGTRVPIRQEARAGRCKGGLWYEVALGAWLCAANGVPRWRFPRGTPQPVLRSGMLVPRHGYYARRDGVPVFLTREDAQANRHDRLVERGFSFSLLYGLRLGSRRFVMTRKGEIVPREDLYLYQPSRFQGRALQGRPSERLACSVAYKHAPVRARPDPSSRIVDRLPHHTWVTVHETQGRGTRRYHRIGPDRWVSADALRPFHFTDPPAGIRPAERWVEVLLRHQTLVAYEGARPVYATLVSTGRWEHRTPSGLFRARTKVALSTMANRKGAGELYRVDDVPWIFYFLEGYALHGTYWHDSFGVPKSHGCINLAPTDARWLFAWAPPRLPTGWEALETSRERPGLLIRIRSHPGAEVEYRGPTDQRPAHVTVADR